MPVNEPDWDAKRRALEAAELGAGTQKEAAEAAGVRPNTITYWKQNDPEFRRQWEEVQGQVADRLEMSALRRAEEGDATLTIFLLKSLRPAKFRDTIRVEQVQSEVERVARLYGVSAMELVEEAQRIVGSKVPLELEYGGDDGPQ